MVFQLHHLQPQASESRFMISSTACECPEYVFFFSSHLEDFNVSHTCFLFINFFFVDWTETWSIELMHQFDQQGVFCLFLKKWGGRGVLKDRNYLILTCGLVIDLMIDLVKSMIHPLLRTGSQFAVMWWHTLKWVVSRWHYYIINFLLLLPKTALKGLKNWRDLMFWIFQSSRMSYECQVL